MDNFSFLKSLNESITTGSSDSDAPRTKLTNGIKYSEYDIPLISGKVSTVFIPERNSSLFESDIEDTVVLTEVAVRFIMRKHNGVTEI